jgi:hypothetical protein
MLGLMLAGCGTDAPADAGRLDYCAGYCDGLVRCNLADSGCTSSCIDTYHPRGRRNDGLSRIGDCLRHESCDVLGQEDDQDACWKSSAAQEPLRPALASYCESESLNDYRCNVFWPVEECVKAMGLWEDSVLARAQECHSWSCDTLQSCEKAVFDSP